ncbi:MAG: hypothetical protein M1816_004572 [Peltula sp. TS41687]|nr:MAG: hypothetical protein M1816_004572 [Peltula sp. TS41687]
MGRPSHNNRVDDSAPTTAPAERDKRYSGSGSRERASRERDGGGGQRTSRSQARKSALPPSRSQTSSSQLLSAESLAKLNAENEKATMMDVVEDEKRRKRKRKEKHVVAANDGQKHDRKVKKTRVVSGPVLEKGGSSSSPRRREGDDDDDDDDDGRRGWERRRRWFWIAVGIFVLLLVILIPVGVLVVGKHDNRSGGGGGGGGGSAAGSSGSPSNSNLRGISESDIPSAAKGTILDPFVWYDTEDFNVTYTDAKVGGLPIMGLNSTWDDTAKANEKVPALNEAWEYGKMPIRGVNVGGWLALEPFITPSLFEAYDRKLGIVDEYTLTKHLGATEAAKTLEKHYATFVTEQTFADIAAAGLDHVRIPFSYWAVVTYPGDPYVAQISWRYLLRGIEWARKHGLRVNLDLHSVPGSQNGWNHSGRQGLIGWINGTDGAMNVQRSLDIHNQLSTFFAQPRYKNIIAIYGLLNEPKMIKLPVDAVTQWTGQAVQMVQKNGITAKIAVGEGFLGLAEWKGRLTQYPNLVLDAHQYIIFNTDQLGFPHQKKLDFVCSGWSSQMETSTNPTTGFGPTICGEWSQADTDCTPHLNNVNVGNRWTGTLQPPADHPPSDAVLKPVCPVPNRCSCDIPNGDAGRYPDAYKKWLRAFADAQMQAFERGWGWFYWNWDTEKSVQWSWKKGRERGILPMKAWERVYICPNNAATAAPGPVGGAGTGTGTGAGTAGGWEGLDESY